MADQHEHETHPTQPPIYQIRVAGHLGRHWAGVFDGLDIRREENGETLLTGPVVDQAALHGVLRRIRDTGMTLLSVQRVAARRSHQSDSKACNE
jgi:hypothetical protein